MAQLNLPPIEPRSREQLSTLVAQSLRTAILSGQLHPGQQLPVEGELCEHFGVSRITVREAAQQLRALGLVESIQGRGTFVTESGPAGPLRELAHLAFGDITAVRDLFEVRGLLETFAARRAALSDPTAGKELLAIVETARNLMEADQDQSDTKIGLSHLHSRFHSELGRFSGNVVLEQFLTHLIDLVGVVRFRILGNPAQPQRYWDQHAAIAHAIIAGDPELIADCVRQHLDDVQRGIIGSSP